MNRICKDTNMLLLFAAEYPAKAHFSPKYLPFAWYWSSRISRTPSARIHRIPISGIYSDSNAFSLRAPDLRSYTSCICDVQSSRN